MGLLNFGKKKKYKSVVWRDTNGTITCLGDSCPQNCDDTCPIYLHTQALMLIQIGQGSKAISIYDEILRIAPDFYDAWNNLGVIYGQINNYQRAYECYIKAHDLNKVKPNAVYGLMLTSRDLGRYNECLQWCDVYNTLTKDGRERPIRDEVNNKLGNTPQSNKTDKY